MKKVLEVNLELGSEYKVLLVLLTPIKILGALVQLCLLPLYFIGLGRFVVGMPMIVVWFICSFCIVNGIWFFKNNWPRPLVFILVLPFLILGDFINSAIPGDPHQKEERAKLILCFPFYELPASKTDSMV